MCKHTKGKQESNDIMMPHLQDTHRWCTLFITHYHYYYTTIIIAVARFFITLFHCHCYIRKAFQFLSIVRSEWLLLVVDYHITRWEE